MNFLKITNFILSISLFTLVFIQFFIKSIDFPSYMLPAFLFVFFLMIGLEKIKSGIQVKSGYFYLGMAIIASLVVIKYLY
ncbi:hypothetical protein Q75_06490 [Bacillus coahuilensis p1.1.43]|uniref:DUF3953 domain-containing protein n=1 Tax=Bacillus coahuilensis p1.1.43 TaxID=1150625 RepID=A0A147K9S9_9BACI|nr:hypothetical protein Q75_06490 [Bacillus coahuilensis p1.1.43]